MKYIPLIVAAALGMASPVIAAPNFLPTTKLVDKTAVVQLAPSRAGRTNICVSQIRENETVSFSGSTNGTYMSGTAQNLPAYVGAGNLTLAGANGVQIGAGAVLCLGAYEGPLYGVAPQAPPSAKRVFSITEIY